MSVHERPAVENSDVLLAALERANDAVVILDHDHRITHFNASAERIWGLARAEVLGRPAAALGLDDLDEDRRTERTIARPDGVRLRVALSLSHVYSGGTPRTIALVRDITPELELRERLALHVMIADGTNDTVWIHDRKTGALAGSIGDNGRMAGYFHWIDAIAIDSIGNLYTGEVDTGKRAQKFVLMNGDKTKRSRPHE